MVQTDGRPLLLTPPKAGMPPQSWEKHGSPHFTLVKYYFTTFFSVGGASFCSRIFEEFEVEADLTKPADRLVRRHDGFMFRNMFDFTC